MTGKQIAAALEGLINALGFTGGRQRQSRRTRGQRQGMMLQCYNCQQLGHTARGCKNAVACLKCAAAHDTRSCTKPRGVACSCANCGGPHAANSRSCGYLRESRRLPAAPRPAATSSASTAAPPPRSGEGCEPRRLESVTDHAVAGFQAAFAAERAALKEELAAVHRQLQQLRDELRANKKKPPVPAAAPAVSRPVGVAVATQTPAAVSRPVGVDVATQTAAAPPPAAMQEVAPMDTDDVPPRLPPSAVAAASKGAKAPPVSSQAEKPTKKRRIHLPFPDVTNVQVVLKDITAALKNGSYPYADQPYPFTPPDQPIPSLPHRPLPLRTVTHLWKCSQRRK
ncbi:calphotin-like [Schistocerca americana]|uniref:calphotin-like n=1 Tax=Schistocerca americana TaxID=7009 RepID=UPI001F50239E|nr:calphotin-like [Schistocerca americana]